MVAHSISIVTSRIRIPQSHIGNGVPNIDLSTSWCVYDDGLPLCAESILTRFFQFNGGIAPGIVHQNLLECDSITALYELPIYRLALISILECNK